MGGMDMDEPMQQTDVPTTAQQAIPPAPRDKFDEMLGELYKRSGFNPNLGLLTVGNRAIDLYQLHAEVMSSGGVSSVRRRL